MNRLTSSTGCDPMRLRGIFHKRSERRERAYLLLDDNELELLVDLHTEAYLGGERFFIAAIRLSSLVCNIFMASLASES